jgi:hypothetical protein
LVVAIVALIATSESFEKCIHERKDHEAYKALHEERPLLVKAVIRLELHAACARVTAGENDGAIVALLTLALAAFTYRLWKSTDNLWRSAESQLSEFRRSLDHSEAVAERQSADMLASITEAARAAAAMESVAVSTAKNSTVVAAMAENQQEFGRRQMRAYLTVLYGAVVPQDNETKWRTEVRLILVNTGHTPAHRVSYRAKTQVLPVPLPDDFDFPLPEGEPGSTSVIGPGQNIIMSSALDRLLTDAEIAGYTTGDKRVYMWGIAVFTDIFDVPQTVKFCQYVSWLRDGTSQGINTRRHNEAT